MNLYKSNSRIEFWGQGNVLLEVPKGTARGYHKQNIANIGWSKLEIETSPDYPDNVQAYSAGMLEGSLTWQLIYWRWRNNIDTVCDQNYATCDDIRTRLSAWGKFYLLNLVKTFSKIKNYR